LTKVVTSEVAKRTWQTNFEKFITNDSNSFLLTSEAEETINQNEEEKYFYDYVFGGQLDNELKEIIERRRTRNKIK
jgi:hypothetical protein